MIDINIFKKKTLFIFSDPGGAKPILSFIKLNNLKNFEVISDRNYKFYDLFKLKIKIRKTLDLKFLKDFKPNIIFVGTSYLSKLELIYIEYAKKNNIENYAYIDHYSRIKERFKYKNSYLFPNNILFVDEKSKKIAELLKINRYSKLIVLENYYLSFLKQWKSNLDKQELLELYSIHHSTKIILFAPDPLSNLDWKSKYDFDELVLWQIISSIKSEVLNDVIILIKMHPNQNKKYLKSEIIKSKLTNYIIIDDKNLLDLIYHSDLIIGIFSTFLVEASIINSKIIRYIPPNIEDFLKNNSIGKIFKEPQNLHKFIEESI